MQQSSFRFPPHLPLPINGGEQAHGHIPPHDPQDPQALLLTVIEGMFDVSSTVAVVELPVEHAQEVQVQANPEGGRDPLFFLSTANMENLSQAWPSPPPLPPLPEQGGHALLFSVKEDRMDNVVRGASLAQEQEDPFWTVQGFISDIHTQLFGRETVHDQEHKEGNGTFMPMTMTATATEPARPKRQVGPSRRSRSRRAITTSPLRVRALAQESYPVCHRLRTPREEDDHSSSS